MLVQGLGASGLVLALVVGPVFAPLLVSLAAAAAVARGVADGAARLRAAVDALQPAAAGPLVAGPLGDW